MTLSSSVPALISRNLGSWLDTWLHENQLHRSGIRSWAIHPGGPRVLKTVEQTLELPEKATWASRQVLTDHGNMSSATMVFILDKLIAADAPLPAVALAFGPGLTIEAAILE